MKNEHFQRKVDELGKNQGWNHYYNFDGVETMKKIDSPGFNLNKWERMKKAFLRHSINGVDVLDVGSSDGFFSIEAGKMGAAVDGIDPDPERVRKANFAKSCSPVQAVDFYCTSIYDFEPEITYDMTFALGLIHRIPDIYTALEVITGCSKSVLLEYKTLDDKRPICLWGGGEKKLNKFNQLYFIPTVSFVEGIMKDFGFGSVYLDKDEESHLNYKRTIQLFEKL